MKFLKLLMTLLSGTPMKNLRLHINPHLQIIIKSIKFKYEIQRNVGNESDELDEDG